MSAQTMRRLVKLAYAKQENNQKQQETVFLSDNSQKNKHLARGKTLTDVRVQRGVSPEQKVAHRLSVTMQQQRKEAESLHIRSFSLPKEKTPLAPDSTKASDHDIDGIDGIETMDDDKKHSSHPTITITMAPSSNSDEYHKNNINNLPPTAMNNMLQPSSNKTQSAIHQSAASDTHTINSEFSESVYTEDATEYTNTKDDESQYAYSNLKASTKNKGRGGGSLMSINSMSSTVESSFMSSNKKSPPAGITLETVQEPSANMKYADEEMMSPSSGHSDASPHISQQSVVQHMTA
eukprot:395434_1